MNHNMFNQNKNTNKIPLFGCAAKIKRNALLPWRYCRPNLEKAMANSKRLHLYQQKLILRREDQGENGE